MIHSLPVLSIVELIVLNGTLYCASAIFFPHSHVSLAHTFIKIIEGRNCDQPFLNPPVPNTI